MYLALLSSNVCRSYCDLRYVQISQDITRDHHFGQEGRPGRGGLLPELKGRVRDLRVPSRNEKPVHLFHGWKTAWEHSMLAGKPRTESKEASEVPHSGRVPTTEIHSSPKLKGHCFPPFPGKCACCIIYFSSEGVPHALLIWKDSLSSVANLSPSNINDYLL